MYRVNSADAEQSDGERVSAEVLYDSGPLDDTGRPSLVLEHHDNDALDRGTARVERQLATYAVALKEEAIERAYGYDHAVRVLCVFDTSRGEALVRERVGRREDIQAVAAQLFFRTLGEVEDEFVGGWRRTSATDSRPLFA